MAGIEDEIMCAAKNGHNIIITGQAGTGKSCIMLKLKKELEQSKVVFLTATTGISSSVLGEGARTVHSFFGFKDGRYSNAQLIDTIIRDDNNYEIKEKLLCAHVILIDEVSMLSLKLIKQIEVLLKNVRDSNLPFGGVQIILSGDFYQLKPVPSPQYNDNGEYILQVLDRFHNFQLKKVHRQTEDLLIRTIHLVSRGETTQEIRDFLFRMKRTLPPGEPPVKLYAENYDVDVFNAQCLLAAEGPMKTYTATDSGDLAKLGMCAASKRLCLKQGCPVILIVNITQNLVNGLRGTVHNLDESSVTVDFKSIGLRKISTYTFTVYDKEQGRDVVFRKQIPLKAAFSLTVHKCQGLTLDRVEIDCRHMNNPEQIGVAIGRIKCAKGLRVINFNGAAIRPHTSEVNDYYKKELLALEEDLSCCKHETVDILQDKEDKSLGPDLNFKSNEQDYSKGYDGSDSDFDSDYDDEDLTDIKMMEELFKDYDEDTFQEEDSNVSFDYDIDLDKIIYKDPKTEQQKSINSCFDTVQKNKESLKTFCTHIYSEMNSYYEKLPEKKENKHFTSLYSKLSLFMSGPRYKSLVQSLFSTLAANETQYRAAFYIVELVRKLFLEKKCEPIIEQARKEASTLKTYKDSKGGRAKVRYIGGWCVAKLRYNRKRKVLRNLYVANKMTGSVNACKTQVRLLDQLTATQEDILNKTSDLASLSEIQRKQNAGNGLLNLSDSAFGFFLSLDKALCQTETMSNLHLYGKSFYDHVKEQLYGNDDLIACWKQLFRNEDDFVLADCEDIIMDLLNDVLSKYIRMSSSQFRREYKKKLHVQKEEAHRKQIMMRQKRKAEGKGKGKEVKKSKKEENVNEPEEVDTVTNVCKLRKYKLKKSTNEESVVQPKNVDTVKNVCKLREDTVEKSTNAESVCEPKKVETVKKMRKVRKSKVVASTSKQSVEYPCSVCEQECVVDSVCCDLCDKWNHFECLGKSGEEEEFIADWFCAQCKN